MRTVREIWADGVAERLALPRLLELVPPPGRRTLDLGPGDGRFGRELIALGHDVVGADGAALPYDDGMFDLVTAFMSLMDMDNPDAAIREAGRVLEPGGRFCFCIAHPLATAGAFAESAAGLPFVLTHSYFEERRVPLHRPLDAWTRALREAGFAIEALREHRSPLDLWDDEAAERWARIPLFLHVRAVRS